MENIKCSVIIYVLQQGGVFEMIHMIGGKVLSRYGVGLVGRLMVWYCYSGVYSFSIIMRDKQYDRDSNYGIHRVIDKCRKGEWTCGDDFYFSPFF